MHFQRHSPTKIVAKFEIIIILLQQRPKKDKKFTVICTLYFVLGTRINSIDRLNFMRQFRYRPQSVVSFFYCKIGMIFIYQISESNESAEWALMGKYTRTNKNIIEQRRGGEETKKTNKNGKNQVWSIRNNKFSCHLTHLVICVCRFP